MSTSNIVDKILEDATAYSKRILEEADSKANTNIQAAKKKAISILEKENVRATEEAKNKADRLIQSAKLVVRNDKLNAKQELIAEVVKDIISELCKMSDEGFEMYCEEAIADLVYENQVQVDSNIEIIVTPKRKDVVTDLFVEKLRIKNGIGRIDIIIDEKLSDGFLIKQDGIYYNYLFKDTVESMRAELTLEISQKLF